MGIESKNGFDIPQITTRPAIDVLPNEETVDRVVNKMNQSLADRMREDREKACKSMFNEKMMKGV